MDKKILVVEDEGITSMELQRKLKFWGYEISSIAFSKKEAIKEVQNRIPDLILMDVALKGNGDGIDAAKEIKNLFDIPIIYITAYDDEMTRRRAEETNPSGYMVKPVNDKVLKQTIKDVLEENEQDNKLILTGEWMDKNLISSDLSIISIDANGYIKYMNESAEDLIGKKSSPDLGIDLIDVFKIRKGENTEIPVENIINVNSSNITNNVNIVTKHGDEIPIEFITNPILEDSGEFIGAVILFRDVSEQISEESDLKFYKKIYNSSSIATGLFNDQGKILEANDTLMKLFNVSEKSDLEHIPILPHSRLNQENATKYELKLDLKGYKKLNSYETAPSGMIHLKAVLTPLLDNKKDSVVYILQLQDITVQRLKDEKLEKRREDNLELQRTNEDLNDVIRNQQIDREKLNNELDNLKRKIELNQTTFVEKEKELIEEVRSKDEFIKEIQEKYTELQNSEAGLNEQIKNQQTEYEKLNNELTGLKNEIIITKSDFDSKEKELMEKIRLKEESHSRLQKMYDDSRDEFKNLENNVQNLKSELSLARSDLEKEQQKYTTHKNMTQERINNLEKENQAQKNNIIEIDDMLAALIVKNKEREKELQEEIESLNRGLEDKSKEFEDLKESSQLEIDNTWKIAEEREDVIQEKELLLKNFQKQFKKDIRMISGLSGLQSQYFQEQMVNNFREGQNMIKSIMLMHEKLYETDDLENINFKEYINKVVDDLAISYNIDKSKIDIQLHVEDLNLDIDKTNITGLIINELVSNSFKYAFTPEEAGRLGVHIWRENQELIMDICDSGIGLPDNINIETADTLGLQLIRMLLNQIDGSIKYQNDKGAHFVIRFPDQIKS